MAPDQAKRCDFDNEWTFGDGFQTLCNAGCWRPTSTRWSASIEAVRRSTRLPADINCTGPPSSTTSTGAGVARRRVVRKMTDESVALAAARYEQGASLAVVAREFGVHQRTLARELRQAAAPIRLRQGWTKCAPRGGCP